MILGVGFGLTIAPTPNLTEIDGFGQNRDSFCTTETYKMYKKWKIRLEVTPNIGSIT